MPGKSTIAYGNLVLDTMLYLPAVTFPTLAANASGSNTATLIGALPGDLLSWNMQNPPAHLVLDNVYVSSANTITIVWSSDATGIATSTVPVLFELCRFENSNLGLSVYPTALV